MNKEGSVGLGECGSERKGGPESDSRFEICGSGDPLFPRAVGSSLWLERASRTPLGAKPLEPLDPRPNHPSRTCLSFCKENGPSQSLHATASGLGPPNKGSFPKQMLSGRRRESSAHRDAILLNL